MLWNGVSYTRDVELACKYDLVVLDVHMLFVFYMCKPL